MIVRIVFLPSCVVRRVIPAVDSYRTHRRWRCRPNYAGGRAVTAKALIRPSTSAEPKARRIAAVATAVASSSRDASRATFPPGVVPLVTDYLDLLLG